MSLDLEPQQSMKEIVEAEIQNENRQNEEKKLAYYLNNFPCLLPCSTGESMNDFVRRNLRDKLIDKSQRYCDLWKRTGETVEQFVQGLRKQGYSDKRIFDTEEQFQQNIHTAIEQSGIDADALIRYIDSHIKEETWPAGDIKNHKLVKELVLPIFIKLREMGYTRRDLI